MVTSHELTLLDVIQAVSEVATNDWETLATVVHLIRSGQVRLCHDAVRAIMDVVAMVNTTA
jgi:hypothetical protein